MPRRRFSWSRKHLKPTNIITKSELFRIFVIRTGTGRDKRPEGTAQDGIVPADNNVPADLQSAGIKTDNRIVSPVERKWVTRKRKEISKKS